MFCSSLAPGDLLSERYRLEHKLGEGGMGSVWAATDLLEERAVAVKFPKDRLREIPKLRRRFAREASAARALNHPNVVHVMDVFDAAPDCPVLVMELLRGETLAETLHRRGRLELSETAGLLEPVLSAVSAAHALGIVHRDIKPDNIFLSEPTAQPVVKVLDFGIAKLIGSSLTDLGSAPLITTGGALLGTPCYMAPEQATGEATDHRADVWSIGVVLYECLSGIRPIQGNNLAHLVLKLVNPGVVPLSELSARVPADVCALTMRMLSRSPEARPSLDEVLEILRRHRTVSPQDHARDGAPTHAASGHRAPSSGAPSSGAPNYGGQSYATPWRAKNMSTPAPASSRLRNSCATTAALPEAKRRWWRPVLAAACAVVVVGLLTSWPEKPSGPARVTAVP